MDKEKKKALKEIDKLTKNILKEIKAAQKIANKHGVNFYLDLNGTGGTYYGKGHVPPPSEDDFASTEEGIEAFDKALSEWEAEHGEAHPWGDYGWVSSSFDC